MEINKSSLGWTELHKLQEPVHFSVSFCLLSLCLLHVSESLESSFFFFELETLCRRPVFLKTM